MKLLFIGNPGGTNVADSLLVAARALGHEASLIPATDAFRTSQLRRRVSWHLLGHRPPRLAAFSRRVLDAAQAFAPDHIIATGLAPITAEVLADLKGARRTVYLTDDPWNPDFKAHWFFEALPNYDVVCTTRTANIDDLRAQGCRAVHHVRFGYDPRHFYPTLRPKDTDAFFAGGAEAERIEFLAPILTGEFKVSLAGDFWTKSPITKPYAVGHYDPQELREATAAARVNLCMVRSRNRDGHVMRSLETAAVGAAMLVQDTEEHRRLFEDDVAYFKTPKGLAARLRDLLADKALRRDLSDRVAHRITTGNHTYQHRLQEILSLAD